MRFYSLLAASLLSLSLVASETQKEISKVSEAFGHLIGKNIDTIGIDFDIELVMKGLRDAAEGKNSPMTEEECIGAISNAQKSAFKHKAEANLKNAEDFLKGNGKQKNIVSLEEGKIQYKIEKKGKGQEVEPHSSPVIHYVGRYLDGTVFGESKEDESITLDNTIQGFQKGLVGMKEGETRTLYIHPELGYGTQGHLPPNSLLTFEIEIVKANAPKEEPADNLILESDHDEVKSLDAHNVR
ncbi:MAG: FKBP-type peptidyl-prolyl cis-trans isomerase [Simkaniaceae bacterium]|nr:FKBP-type peptidyl-prolyl cis-trans isomerase [Candidatus Sacchlamyda saccharinae]